MLVSAIVLFSQNIMIEFSAFLSIILFFLLNLFAHEISHMIVGKANGFKTRSFRFLFFRFYKDGKKLKISVEGMGNQAGEAEIYPISSENLINRYKKVAIAGVIANAVLTVISIVFIPFWGIFANNDLMILTQLTVFGFPISLYFTLENGLPMSSGRYRNDGAIVYGINKNDPVVKVLLSLMIAETYLYQGKTLSEIDEKYLFDLPQLAEDEPNFAILLTYRYYYYLDKGDLDKAKETAKRLESIYDYMDKYEYTDVQADMLYNYSTFMLDEDEADNILEDNEKYLNKVLSPRNLRAKCAYSLNILKDKELALDLYEMAVKLANKAEIKGLGLMEIKLLDKLKEEIDAFVVLENKTSEDTASELE